LPILSFDPIRGRRRQAESPGRASVRVGAAAEPAGAAPGIAFAARLPALRGPDAWDSLAAAAEVPARRRFAA